TNCVSGKVFSEPKSNKCVECSTINANCVECSSNGERKCIKCRENSGFYLLNGNCVACDSTCKPNTCDSTSGFCSQCLLNYTVTSPISKVCVKCSEFDSYCSKCAVDYTRKCELCSNGKYPKPSKNYKCGNCDFTCGGSCSGTTGACTGCSSNYVFSISNNLVCDSCATFDSNCLTCDSTYQRKCSVCRPSGMYPSDSTYTCVSCDATCNGNCDQTTGKCTGCINNYVFEATKSRVCVACKSFDQNCKVCSSDYNRKCVECESGFYPNESGGCVFCNTTITNCKSCNSKENKCLSCQDPYYLFNQTCLSCASGSYKNTETSCEKCYIGIPNCQTCSTKTVGIPVCTACYSPYAFDSQTGVCESCGANTFYNATTKKCENNGGGCLTSSNQEQCLSCSDGYYLSNNKCVSATNCVFKSTLSKISCDCSDQISVGSDCQSTLSKCKYQKNYKNQKECIQCEDKYVVNDNTCQNVVNILSLRNGVVYRCDNGNYLNENNQCVTCKNNSSICINYKSISIVLSCGNNSIYNVETMSCNSDNNCLKYGKDYCSKCVDVNMELKYGKCSVCSVPNCKYCEGGKCKRCNEKYVIQTNGFCFEQSEVGCAKANGMSCPQCNEGFYAIETLNNEGKYDFCIPISNTQIADCKYSLISQSKCVECFDSFKLKNGKCSEQFEDQENDEENNSTITKQDKKGVEVSCFTRNNKGCERCISGYYFNNSECEKCPNHCYHCYNTSYCLTCDPQYYLSSTFTCEPLGNLFTKCDLTLPTGGGCAICKDHYYKQKTDCISCDESCGTCVDSTSCLSCQNEHFKLSGSESKLCVSYDNLTNCETKTPIGCLRCEDGYYLDNYICKNCSENCISCDSYQNCKKCVEKDYVLVDSQCVSYKNVEFCLSANNSKCTECEGFHKPSDAGDYCVKVTNYGLVVGVPISVTFVIIVFIVAIILIAISMIQKRKQKKKEQNICNFKMSRSNIEMVKLSANLVSNKTTLKFDLDDNDPLKVDIETRDLVCIGNVSKSNLKVQFSVMEGCDYYEIRSVPPLVTLKPGYACEFEIIIKPLCTCVTKESVAITS
ncbi:hypothetical protein EIN_452320, partial [Entamoeba invadens IP1]